MNQTKLHNWQRWAGRGVWAVADQGLFAVSSALLNLLLARWLRPAEYGAFAVAYTVFLLIGAVHTALFTEPMLVFGSSKYASSWLSYIRVLLRGHWLLTGVGTLLLFILSAIFWLVGSNLISQAVLGLAVATPFTLLLWLMRRAAYARARPQLATMASAVYLLLIAGGLFALNFIHIVSTLSVMLCMAVASAAAGLWLMSKLCGASLPETDQAGPPAPSTVLAAHWNYGRWAIATSILMWVPLNFYFIVLSGWVSLEASASLRALTNLVLPLLQANAALSALLLPPLVVRAGNPAAFKKLLRSSLILFFAGATIYAVLLGTFGRPLVHLLYGGKYDGAANLIWLVALLPILDGIVVVLASALRSMERPKLVFWANLGAAGCVLTLGIWATSAWGIRGAALGMILADLLAVAVLVTFVFKSLQSVPSTLDCLEKLPPLGWRALPQKS
jgi:O-antigen/teichoic acid export membrane protein